MLAIGVIAPVGVLAPHVFKFSRRRFAKNSIPLHVSACRIIRIFIFIGFFQNLSNEYL